MMKTEEIITYKRKQKPVSMAFLSELLSGRVAITVISALMVSRVTVLGNMAPFGIAWYAANLLSDKYYLIFSATILGTLFTSQATGKLSHILTVILLLTTKKLFSSFDWKNTKLCSSASVLCTLLSGGLFALFSGTFYFNIITTFTEALAVGGMCLIFSKSSSVIKQDWKITNDEESVSIAILAGAVVAGFQGISFFGIKAANVLCMYIILFTAYKGGIGISGATGAALGIIAGISQGDAPALTGVYGFMGLVSGVMNIFGKIGVVLSSAFANALFAGYYNSSTIVLVNFIEIAIAGALFFFTPDSVLNYFEKFSIRSPVYDGAGGFVMRLKGTVGEALASLKNSAIAIGEAYYPRPTESETDNRTLIKERLVARVCEGCSLNKYCWSRNIKGSNIMFERIVDALFEENFDEVSAHITGRCVRGDTLCDSAKQLYAVLKRENIIKNRVDGFAKSFSEGWGALLEIIKTKEQQIVSIRPDYALFESELCRVLASGGIKSPEISIIMNVSGRLEVTLRSSKEILFDILPAVEKITGVKMCVSDEYRTSGGFVMKLQEKLKFDYDVSILTMNKQGSDISGDSAEWFVTPEGIFYCLVCDGMGSGPEANNDSQRTIRLFKTLVLSGFKPQNAVKIINGGMLSADHEERSVSFDCLSVDLFTGKTDFIKAGGVASVIKNSGEVSIIRQNSIPLGVLDIDNPPVQTLFLNGDTFIIMMTDGITDNIGDRKQGEDCVAGILRLMDAFSSKEVSDNIMMSAVAEGIAKDDMMVTAIKISGKDV